MCVCDQFLFIIARKYSHPVLPESPSNSPGSNRKMHHACTENELGQTNLSLQPITKEVLSSAAQVIRPLIPTTRIFPCSLFSKQVSVSTSEEGPCLRIPMHTGDQQTSFNFASQCLSLTCLKGKLALGLNSLIQTHLVFHQNANKVLLSGASETPSTEGQVLSTSCFPGRKYHCRVGLV